MHSSGTENLRSLGWQTPVADAAGRRGTRLSLVMVQITLAALMTVPAWMLGGVQAQTQFWLFVVAGCATLICWGICLGRGVSIRPLPAALVPLALALVMVALQTIPLPATVHRWVSPRTQRWWQELAPSTAAVSEPADHGGYSLSLYPASTRRESYRLALAVAAFTLGAVVLAARTGFAIAGLAVAVNGAALAFFGLAQQLTWNGRLYWSVELSSGGVPFASYVNRNNAAGFLNMCLACAIALSVWGIVHASYNAERRPRGARKPSRAGRTNSMLQSGWRTASALGRNALTILARLNFATVAGLIAAACIAAGICCSLSRGGTLAMLGAATITLLAAALAGRWRRGWLGPMFVTGLAACLLTGYVGQDGRVKQRLATLLDESARHGDGRLVHWPDGVRAAEDLLPAGSGLGTYRYIYRAYQAQPYTAWFYHAENQYLQTLVEAGLAGLGLLLAALALVALACWRLLLRAPDPATYALGVAGTFALSSQAIHAGFDFGLYLPANMLLLAAICGAVCGRAAWIESPLGREADGSLRWSALLIALPPLRPLAASCCVALTGLLLLAGGEARRAAAVEAALAEIKPLDLDQPQPIEVLDRCLSRFTAGSVGAVEDVEAQLKLAQLWIHRMRVGLVDVIRRDLPEGVSAAAMWTATDTVRLHGRMQQWAAHQRTDESAALRTAPPVTENLPAAIGHLKRARRLCPLLPEIHLLLAQWTILADEHADNRVDLERVRMTAPGQPAILTRCGLLELQSGHIALACQSWRSSLALAPEQLPQILRVARPVIDLAAHIAELVPASPAWILDVAEGQFGAQADRPIRQALLVYAASLVASRPEDDAQASWLRGRIAAIQGNSRQAVAHFTRAVATRPDETAWRYDLAVALKEGGRFSEAQEQVRVCARMEPGNERYDTLLREMIRIQLAPTRPPSGR